MEDGWTTLRRAGLVLAAAAALATSFLTTAIAGAEPTAAAVGDDFSGARANIAQEFSARPLSPTMARTITRPSAVEIAARDVVTFADSLFDTAWPEADLYAAGANMTASGVTALVVGVQLWTDPFNDDWRLGDTGPLWEIDVNGDDVYDFYTGIVNVNGSVGGLLLDAGDNVVCEVESYTDASLGTYGVAFSTFCLGANIPSIRIKAMMGYHDVSLGLASVDIAPNFGWSPTITNDAYVPVAPPAGSAYVALSPARLLETRSGLATVDGAWSGIGARTAGSVTGLVVAGRGGVPVDASAVVLNVTVTEAEGPGFVTVFPCGSPQPNASNLNFVAGSTIPNLVIAKVGVGGRVCLYTMTGTHLLVDVNGYYPAGSTFGALSPARLLETRAGLFTIDGVSNGIGLRPAGAITELPVAGRGGVPADASAVVLNVTVTEAEGPGFVTVFPCGSPQPNASNLNFVAGSTIPNLVIAKVGAGGSVCLFTMTGTHLVADVNGYYPAESSFGALSPARLLETRPDLSTIDGVANDIGLRPAGSITELPVAGRGGVPPDASAVVLNVTVTEATGPGFVTVFPCGSSPPNASNLNYVAGSTIPNLVVAKVGAGGNVCLFTLTATHLIADVNGYH